MHNLITPEIKALTHKSMIHFKEFYKNKENRQTLNLTDFIIYSIIRGKDMDITVRDSNYTEGKCPMSYHGKFIGSVHDLKQVSNELLAYFNLKQGTASNPYRVSYLMERVKEVFGLTILEFNTLFSVYFEIKTERREKAA